MDEKRIHTIYFLALFGIILLFNVFVFKAYFTIIFLALTIAVIFKPVYVYFLKILKKEFAASLAAVTVVFLVIILPLTALVWQIFLSAKGFVIEQNESNKFISQLLDLFVPIKNYASLNLDLTGYIKELTSLVANNLGSIFSSIAQIIFTFILMLVSMFFIFKDSERLKKAYYALMLLPKNVSNIILEKMEIAINSVIRGQLTIALAQSVLTMIGFSIFGLPNAILWGSTALIASLIPNIGTALVIGPAVVYLYFSGNVSGSLGLAVWGLLAVGLIDNFMGPLLIKKGTKLHPLAILFSVIGGLSLFGPLGFLLGPILLSLLVVLFEIRFMILEQ